MNGSSRLGWGASVGDHLGAPVPSPRSLERCTPAMPVVSWGGEHDTCHMTADPRRRGRQIPGACSVERRMRIQVWLRIAFGIAAVAAVATGCVSRVHPHAYLPPVKLGEPSFFPTLEAYTASPIVGGNAVDLLLNGDESF